MDLLQLDIDQLAEKLRPYVDGARQELADFAGDVSSDLSKKASTGLTSLAFGALRSLGNAVLKRIKSSRAHEAFERQWEAAKSNRDKEEAIRRLLRSDPKLADALHGLLIRRDFVRAMVEHCEHLPNIGLIDSTRRLSEIFVPLSLERASESNLARNIRIQAESKSDYDPVELLRHGNHLIEGIAGSGKSTFARYLVVSEGRRLLESNSEVSFDRIRLPALVSARTLCAAKLDFASSMSSAINADISFANLGPLPKEFFVPYADLGHSSWLIVIDGLDEIQDQWERQRFWDAISKLHSQFGEAFSFIVTTRPDVSGLARG